LLLLLPRATGSTALIRDILRAMNDNRVIHTRNTLSEAICARLDEEMSRLGRQWQESGPINHFVIDDLLPKQVALEIRAAFPGPEEMVLKRSLRELKFVSAQMNKHSPLLEEIVYAFQTPSVVSRIEKITRLKSLEPDHRLYAGGISLMSNGHFLNPHIDNSHDKFRDRYRVLNLLYYVSPGWSESNGGNLELWQRGMNHPQQTVTSRFNRLAVMVTHQHSWHSVSRVITQENRCCVSNYYFSSYPVGEREYFQVTSFRGRPEQPMRDVLLRGDIWLRTLLRRFFPKGVKDNPHFYKKPE
jgi:Rps23 Pro-64 3,4-dihydroxylase Tpa1-like proline 4-hydroxylase